MSTEEYSRSRRKSYIRTMLVSAAHSRQLRFLKLMASAIESQLSIHNPPRSDVSCHNVRQTHLIEALKDTIAETYTFMRYRDIAPLVTDNTIVPESSPLGCRVGRMRTIKFEQQHIITAN